MRTIFMKKHTRCKLEDERIEIYISYRDKIYSLLKGNNSNDGFSRYAFMYKSVTKTSRKLFREKIIYCDFYYWITQCSL